MTAAFPPVSQLSVLYRTFPGTNDKQRPDWSSRSIALASIRRALADVAIETRLTFVADGGLPDELVPLIGPRDQVVVVRGGSAAASLRRCVDVARELAAVDPAGTCYWFAEDDYLYRPAALANLVAAMGRLPDVEYFTLYTADGSAWHHAHPSQPYVDVPPLPGGMVDAEGVPWHRVRGTTSTFGVRRQALLDDSAVLKLATRAGSPFDGTTWHALQGYEPYAWRHLLADLDGYWRPRGIAKVVAKPLMRSVVNLEVRLHPGRARRLVAPSTDLAMHLEASAVPADGGWRELAAELSAGGPDA